MILHILIAFGMPLLLACSLFAVLLFMSAVSAARRRIVRPYTRPPVR